VQPDRRGALLGLASVPALLAQAPAEAAYGDAANVFGKTVNTSGAPPHGAHAHLLVHPCQLALPNDPCRR
jgi:hypothetical protein